MIDASDVEVILPKETTLCCEQINAAIEAAVCTLECVDINDSKVDVVTKYLAAHYAAASEQSLSVQSEKDGCCDTSIVYGFKFGEGIKGTPYGQMANTLSCGQLAELDKPQAGIFSLGYL